MLKYAKYAGQILYARPFSNMPDFWILPYKYATWQSSYTEYYRCLGMTNERTNECHNETRHNTEKDFEFFEVRLHRIRAKFKIKV